MKGMKLYLLDNGWEECDRNTIEACAVVGTRYNQSIQNQYIKIPIWCVLIDHPTEGKIMFDLGSHPKAMEGEWPESLLNTYQYYLNPEQDLTKQLALCGTKPEDVKKVILSHAHIDHIGNIEMFTHADVYINRQEFMSAQTIVHQTDDRSKHSAYIRRELEQRVKEYHLLDEDCELFEGIEVVMLPGHTAGTMGMIVHLENETLIFCADAVYTTGIYGPPARTAAMMDDSRIFLQSIEKVRKLEKKYNARIMYGHDMEVYKTWKHAPDFYA